MEDLRKRLDFANPSIQNQAVARLFQQVVTKAGKTEITAGTPKIAELSLLWDKSTDADPIVNSACCEALVTLVYQKHADWEYVVNGVLNIVPSGRNLTAVLKAVSDLLVLQVLSCLQKERTYCCPFQMRTPPHPFITIVVNRADSWPLLLEQVSYLFNMVDHRIQAHVLAMLEPFLKYVFLEPSHSVQYSQLRLGLWRRLLQISNSTEASQAQDIVSFLVGLLPSIQLEPSSTLQEGLLQVEDLVIHLLRHKGEFVQEKTTVACHLLVLTHALLAQGSDITSILDTVLKVADDEPEVLPGDVSFVILSCLLLKAPARHVKTLLKIAMRVTNPDTTDAAIVRVLLFPLLQCVAGTIGSSVGTKGTGEVLTLARDLFSCVEEIIRRGTVASSAQDEYHKVVDPWFNLMSSTSLLVIHLQREPKAACNWLKAVQSGVNACRTVPDHVLLVVSSLVLSPHTDVLYPALKVLTALAQADVTKAPYMLSLLLYRLGKATDPELHMKLLYTAPRLATHKVCIPPILKTLQVLGAHPHLRAVSLRLLTSLWEQQDRSFPHLQKLLLSELPANQPPAQILEMNMAKAASVRDMCKLRAHQHGADLLPVLSQILNDCTSELEAVPASLALQGLTALCQAEVVDVRTAWSVLASKLEADQRPLVLSHVCELFSLVPALAVNTPEYEKFQEQVTFLLWQLIKSKSPVVAGAAFAALSQYNPECFKVAHLPEPVRPEEKTQEKGDGEEEEQEEEEEETTIPGSSYTKLMIMVDSIKVLENFEKFLSSLVQHEMSNMPRGVYHSAGKGQAGRGAQNRAVAGIPAFMLRQYERNKQPGMQQGLAAGLLCCYDYPVQVDGSGAPVRRHVVTRGKMYQKMFQTLLNEVPFQHSEWSRLLPLPQAWAAFMDRVYHAVLEGRRAELEMQQKHQTDTEEEVKYKQDVAWLWVRDKLVDIIKTASVGNPTAQANSVLAVTGLASTVMRYMASLGAEATRIQQEASEHNSCSHWLGMLTDLLMCVADSKYKPKGRTLGLFQQKSRGGAPSCSMLARACSSLAFAQLIPVLVTNNVERIRHMIHILVSGLPGQPQADESSAVVFCHGVGLGMVLARLYEEHFSDVTGREGALLLMKTLDQLENVCFNTDLENSSGCVLGLGIVLSALSGQSATESRVHTTATIEKMCSLLDTVENRDLKEVLPVAVSLSAVSAFSSNVLSAEEADSLKTKLVTMYKAQPQSSPVAQALGMLCHGLSSSGHVQATDLSNQLHGTWTGILRAKSSPTLLQLASLTGLVSLTGTEAALIQMTEEVVESSEVQLQLNDTVKLLNQLVQHCPNVGVQSNTAWMLGYLYMAATSMAHSRSSVPSNYGYLPETSVLRPTVDFIIEAGRRGPEAIPPPYVQTSLEALLSAASATFPPVNWAAILAPLMRLSFGTDIQILCLRLVVSQASASPSAALLLASWVSQPLFGSLEVKCQSTLYSSLPVIMKSLTAAKFKTFLEDCALQSFVVEEPDPILCQSVTNGLLAALKVPDPPQMATQLLYHTVEKVCREVDFSSRTHEVLPTISKCLAELPEDLADKITKAHGQADLLKSCYLRGHLVSHGHVPMTWYNACINGTVEAIEQIEGDEVIQHLTKSLYQCTQSKSQHTGDAARIQWLLEVMGQCRNIAYGKIPLSQAQSTGSTKNKVTEFLIAVFCAAVACWSSVSLPVLWGITGTGCQTVTQSVDTAEASSESRMLETVPLLPYAILQLASSEPWTQVGDKLIDWLMEMYQAPVDLPDKCKTALMGSVLALRHTTAFKKPSVWTRAYQMLSTVKL
ncbi:focadhesin-like [Branchiostoma floridae]|uniref:Focadhesin-like n=1 Tax=Branchiostoma floridae TaxID=7739 RepID=A0A9J7KHD7_BRAFL|nr:focadhesin-like [Branchiostoma floridae]